MKIKISLPQAIYEIGKRDNQEDAIYPGLGEATTEDRLFILCDGMGGHENGEEASNAVSKAMAEYLLQAVAELRVVDDELLLAALEAAYLHLDCLDDGAERKMGTTLSLLFFHQGGLTAMHIGDSRIYHVRPSEHSIVYQSKDHSLVYDLYQAGEISYEEMATSSQKNVITRAIQPGLENRVRPSIVHIGNLLPGDIFYICSDGMLEHMTNEELCTILSADTSDEKKRAHLIAATAGNSDNHSAYLIHVENLMLEQGDQDRLDDEQTSSDNAINIRPHQQVDVEMMDYPQGDVPVSGDGKDGRKSSKHWIVVVVAICLVVVAAIFVKKTIFSNHGEANEVEKREINAEEGDRPHPNNAPMTPIAPPTSTNKKATSSPKCRTKTPILRKDTTKVKVQQPTENNKTPVKPQQQKEEGKENNGKPFETTEI